MLRLVPLLVLLAAIDLPREKEKWISLTADEFTIVSNASERETNAVATNLLRMRDAIGKITRLKVRGGLPTIVYVFKNERSFAPYRDAVMNRPSPRITGVFFGRDDGNFILLQADAPSGVAHVVYHELAHYFVRNTTTSLPLWFNEGLAEYYATFEAADAKVNIGRPIEEHVLWLRGEKLIPLAQLFAIDADSKEYNEGKRQGVFYAQSWALVHYLMNGPADRRKQLPQFLSLLDGKRPVEAAFQEAFGVGYEAMEKELRDYVRGRTFNYTRYTLDDLAEAKPPAPQPITYDEVVYRLGDLLLRSGGHAMAEAERHLEEAIAINPKHAAAHAGLGFVADALDRDADAAAFYEKAVQLGARDPDVYMMYAGAMLEKGDRLRARALLAKALELDPTSARAYAGYGTTFLEDEQGVQQAITAFEKSLSLSPAQEDVAYNLVLLYARSGRGEDAARLTESVIASSGNGDMLREAREAVMLAGMHDAQSLLAQGKEEEALAIIRPILAGTTKPELKSQLSAFVTQIETGLRDRRHMHAVESAVELARKGKTREALAAIEKVLPEIAHDELKKYAVSVREQLLGVRRQSRRP